MKSHIFNILNPQDKHTGNSKDGAGCPQRSQRQPAPGAAEGGWATGTAHGRERAAIVGREGLGQQDQ